MNIEFRDQKYLTFALYIPFDIPLTIGNARKAQIIPVCALDSCNHTMLGKEKEAQERRRDQMRGGQKGQNKDKRWVND